MIPAISAVRFARISTGIPIIDQSQAIMIITSVKATPVSIPATRTCTWSFGRSYGHTRSIIEVTTDAGIVGLGEAPVDRVSPIINRDFAAKLKGVDPYEISTARVRCLRQHRDFGYLADPLAVMAFAAVEIALWDIIGKRRGLPLFRVLGGEVRERAPFVAYAYTVALEEEHRESDVPGIMADIAARSIRETKAEIFEFKVARHSVACDIATVKAIREAVGPNVELAVDANMGFSFENARKFLAGTGDMLGGIEEPVGSLGEMAALRREFGVPISTHCTDIEKLRAYPEIDDIVGDINVDAGIGGVIRLASAIESHEKRFWLRSNRETGIGWAAMCHLGMACPELHRPAQSLINWIEDDLVLGKPWLVRDGGVRPPEKPGLGVELDRDAFERYAERYRTKGPSTRYDAP
jgi:glucarate dehydratase